MRKSRFTEEQIVGPIVDLLRQHSNPSVQLLHLPIEVRWDPVAELRRIKELKADKRHDRGR